MTRSRADGPPPLEVEHLSKSYGHVRAVHDVSFCAAPGEVLCILGPNGSGKSTLIECIEGLRKPDSGSIRILGRDYKWNGRRPAALGVQLQEACLTPRIKVSEALRLFAAIYDVRSAPPELVERLGVGPLLGSRFDALSGGQKRRVELCLAFLMQPAIAVLDEPLSGLDPELQAAAMSLLREQAAAGTAVVATIHDVDQAASVGHSVLVMDKGEILAHGRPESLLAGLGADTCLMLPQAQARRVLAEVPLPHHRGVDGTCLLYGSHEVLNAAVARTALSASGVAWSMRAVNLGDVVPLLRAAAQESDPEAADWSAGPTGRTDPTVTGGPDA